MGLINADQHIYKARMALIKLIDSSVATGHRLRIIKGHKSHFHRMIGEAGITDVMAEYMIKLVDDYDSKVFAGLSHRQAIEQLYNEGVQNTLIHHLAT